MLFIGVPAGSEGNTATTRTAPSMYVKIVNSRATHIEAILKLVATPEELLVERFRVMWPEGQAGDLQLLMSLKGIFK